MTFNKDLFLELCQEYGVQFSKDYKSIMLDDDGNIRELCDEDIEHIMLPSAFIPYSDSECTDGGVVINIPQGISSDVSLLPDNLLAAA